MGCTLTSDRWSDVQRRPVTIFLLVTREDAVFIKSVDLTDHIAEGGRKNATYLAEKSAVSSERLVLKTLFRLLWTGLTKHAGPS